ncbi:hypothetical protein V8F33_011874 [Rhypophila sp. PSN 637]
MTTIWGGQLLFRGGLHLLALSNFLVSVVLNRSGRKASSQANEPEPGGTSLRPHEATFATIGPFIYYSVVLRMLSHRLHSSIRVSVSFPITEPGPKSKNVPLPNGHLSLPAIRKRWRDKGCVQGLEWFNSANDLMGFLLPFNLSSVKGGPLYSQRPGLRFGDEVGPDFHPISWQDYLFASFAPILLALPLAILVQMQSGSLKALLPYYILSSSSPTSPSTAGHSRSSSVTGQVVHPEETAGGGGRATALESLCLITGGPRGIWNGVRLCFVGSGATPATRRKEPLGFLADLHVLVLSAIVSLSSEALSIKLIGRCRADDFRGCHLGVSLFLVPGRIVQALLVVSLAMSVLNGLVLLQRREWRRAMDIHARHGNRGVEGVAELLDGRSEDTREYFRKVSGSAAAAADTDGDGYISTKEMAKHLDDHLFAIRVRPGTATNSVASLTSASTSTSPNEKGGANQPTAAPSSTTYYLEVTPRETKSSATSTWSTDMKEQLEESPSRSDTIESRLGPLNNLSLSPARQDMLGQLGSLLTMVGVLVLVLYYELTSNPDSGFERFMNSQGLGVRALFTSLGVIISLF